MRANSFAGDRDISGANASKIVFPMSRHRIALSILFLLLALPALLVASDERGEGPLNPAPPTGITPQEIIQKFAAKETEFAQARDNYTYTESVKIETLDGDSVTGEFQERFDVLFDDQGKRIMNITYAPPSTLTVIQLDEEDIRDFEQTQPFVLTSAELPEYDITYAGQQREDELNTYVFDIKPKEIDRVKRRFQGRVWVDDHDLQIVKVFGKGVSKKNFEKNHAFADFTTYRQQIDGQFWFPTYTYVDTVLHFPGDRNTLPQDVHIREIARYTNYRRFRSQHKIIYQGIANQK